MEKFDASYGAWKNHISHGNCYRLGKRMDEKINQVLNAECKVQNGGELH